MANFVPQPEDSNLPQSARTHAPPALQDGAEAQPARTHTPPTQPEDGAAAQSARAHVAPIVPDDGLKTVVYSIYPQSDAVKIKIIVYDSSGKIVALPQDVFEGSFEDVVNGGSGAGNFKVPKRFVDSGWINFGYRVQVFLYDGPGDPWYDGFVTEIDPAQDATLDLETQNIHTQGWSSHMAFAIVTETLSPGVQPNGVDNGQYNADTYLSHLVATYYDATVLGPTYIASIPVALDALTFDGQSLDKCIDAIVKQVSDNTGHVFEWWVRGVANGKPALVIQQQSNPALVTTNFFSPAQRLTTSYFTEFQDSTIDSYTIHSDASGLANQIALYGYTAPSTGIQLYGAFQDSTSISLYTLRQKKVTNTTLVSQQSLINYATVYLLLNGYPQPQGRFNKLVASDFARAGQYFQILQPGLEAPDYEYIVTPATGQLAQAAPQVLQQVRAIKVTLSFGTGQDRILQAIETSAPRPFIDHSYYAAIQSANSTAAAGSSAAAPTKLSNYYVLGGGTYVGSP